MSQTVYFSAGCFWNIENKFKKLEGVISTSVGYMGGFSINPTYKKVIKGNTGHAETVEIEYNSNIISYNKLIDFFFKIHDATTLNKQGLNIGTNYRSIVFYNTNYQKQLYTNFLDKLPNKKKIVTELLDRRKYIYYIAENYHQNYIEKKNKIVLK